MGFLTKTHVFIQTIILNAAVSLDEPCIPERKPTCLDHFVVTFQPI